MIRNSLVAEAIENIKKEMMIWDSKSLTIVEKHIERLERENFGLKQKCENYARKEEARKREMGWTE